MATNKPLPNGKSLDKEPKKTVPVRSQGSEGLGSQTKSLRQPAGGENLSDNDISEIIEDTSRMADRDQTFDLAAEPSDGSMNDLPYEERRVGGDEESLMQGMQDMDEGEWGRISDPAFEKEGSAKAQRAYLGDRSIEPKYSPVGVAEGDKGRPSPSLERIANMSDTQLRELANAIGVAGRDQLSRTKLIDAINSAMPSSTYH